MSTLAQDFNVGAVQGGHYQRMDVTLTWDSDIPMEFRLHMWQPTEDGEGITVIWSISRELLATVVDSESRQVIGMGDVAALRVRLRTVAAVNVASVDQVYLELASDNGRIQLSFPTTALASLVRSSLAMCPIESEALDVDGLIHQIFNAEEAS